MGDDDTVTQGGALHITFADAFQPQHSFPRPKVTTRPSAPRYPKNLGKVEAASAALPEIMCNLRAYQNIIDYTLLHQALMDVGHSINAVEWAIHEHVEKGRLQAIAGVNQNSKRQVPPHVTQFVDMKEWCQLVWQDAMSIWWENGCCENTVIETDVLKGHGDIGSESQSKTSPSDEQHVVVPPPGKPEEQEQVSDEDATPTSKEKTLPPAQVTALMQYSQAVRHFEQLGLGYPTYDQAYDWCRDEGMSLSPRVAWERSISRARKRSNLPSLKTRPNNKPHSAVLASELSNKRE